MILIEVRLVLLK